MIKFFLLVLPIYLMAVDVDRISSKIESMKSSHRVPSALTYDVYDPFTQAKPIVKEKKSKKVHLIKKRRKSRHIVIQTILNDMILVNNRWYKEGDRVMGMRVRRIYQNSALIGNQTVKVSRRKSILKTKEIIQ